ncbi:MAG TPA: hypothetical protein VMV17_03800 [Streptosporangiaceae bacterium]|nr:hypothetical protein [Streptosporangiaceae bacterium]
MKQPTQPGATAAGRSAATRLGLVVVLAAVVTAVLAVAGRVHQPDYPARPVAAMSTGQSTRT